MFSTRTLLSYHIVPLLSPKEVDLASAGPLKQTSIDKFFGNKIIMPKRKTKPAATHLKEGCRAVTGVTSADATPGLHESVSPSGTEDDETSSNKFRRGISKSAASTPPTSAVNTPEPTTNETGRARLTRNAKKKLPASLLASASEVDASSVSDFHASDSESDAVTETQSVTDCEKTEDSDADDDDHIILPAAKRMKPNNKSGLASCEFSVAHLVVPQH